MTDPWPWPEDTQLDRARAIARWLLGRLPECERESAIRHARAMGQTWLGAELLRWSRDDVITTMQAAELVQRPVSTIRWWHSAGRLPNQGTGWYRAGDVLDAAARRDS